MAVQRFLPAGQRLVVQKPDGSHTWHVLREDVIITKSSPTRCPRTNLRVAVCEHKGFQVFHLDEQVRTRDVPEDTQIDWDKVGKMRACLLIYDIPERAEINNPSGALRRVGIRANLSCWIIPEDAIPYGLLNTLTEAGASWHTVPFAPEAGKALITIAIQSMKKELQDSINRARRSQAQAATQYEESGESEKAREYYVRRAEGITARVNELIEDFRQAAARFGIRGDALNLDEAASTVNLIGVAMHERASNFARAAEIARTQGSSTSQAILAGIEATGDNSPVVMGALADSLQDDGCDTEAEALRNAFIPQTDEDTFSLVGPDGEGIDEAA